MQQSHRMRQNAHVKSVAEEQQVSTRSWSAFTSSTSSIIFYPSPLIFKTFKDPWNTVIDMVLVSWGWCVMLIGSEISLFDHLIQYTSVIISIPTTEKLRRIRIHSFRIGLPLSERYPWTRHGRWTYGFLWIHGFPPFELMAVEKEKDGQHGQVLPEMLQQKLVLSMPDFWCLSWSHSSSWTEYWTPFFLMAI